MPHPHTTIAKDAVLGGRYRLGEEIAVGGSARVVAAVDERLGRRVAVKLLDVRAVEASDPAARQRFLREARTAAGFSHPHAVAVFDAGEDAGVLYLVMELVDGPSLARVLAGGALPVDRAVRIASQVLAALEAAHLSGVVHRDVKPANVLLTPSGDAKLADFGIAKRFDDLTDSVTRTGFVVGTPRYLAPEQALGQPLSPATDVYAVGVLLYEMLTGEAPYHGATPSETAMAHHVAPVPDLAARRPDVPAGVAAVVARALAKDPRERYASAGAMASALQRRPTDTQVMASSAVRTAARRPPARPARRPWWPLAVFAALVVLALVGVAIATDDPAVGPAATSIASATSAPAVTVAPTVAPSAAATVPATAASPPPTSPPTLPPTTVPPVAEVIPGFPATSDLDEFLRQLEEDPVIVGDAGGELADLLDELLEEGGNKQADRAEELQSRLSEWTEEGRIAPEISVALEPLIAPLADRPGRGNDDGDD